MEKGKVGWGKEGKREIKGAEKENHEVQLTLSAQTGTIEVCLLVFIKFSWFMSDLMSYYCSIKILTWEGNR